MGQFIGTTEFSQLLKVSTVAGWRISLENLTPVVRTSRFLLFDRSEAMALLERRRAAGMTGKKGRPRKGVVVPV
jgi:hypothetical protein